MFNLSRMLVTAISFLFLYSTAWGSETITWQNSGGSVATITYNETNTSNIYSLSGTYVNGETGDSESSEDDGFSCLNQDYPLTGYYNSAENLISFTVAWTYEGNEDCKSITGWTGYIDSSGDMQTNWWLVEEGGEFYPCDSSDDNCQDTFTRQ